MKMIAENARVRRIPFCAKLSTSIMKPTVKIYVAIEIRYITGANFLLIANIIIAPTNPMKNIPHPNGASQGA